MASTIQGSFQAIESFAIRRREEFYLIGQLTKGEVQAQWFAHIQLNPSFAITVEIKQVETVEIADEKGIYQLLIVAADSEEIDLLIGLNIGNEPLKITIEGGD